jgi:carbonic anhydrase
VSAQARNVCHTTTVQDAWRAGKDLSIHAWIYSLTDGLLKDLGVTISNPDQLAGIYRTRR